MHCAVSANSRLEKKTLPQGDWEPLATAFRTEGRNDARENFGITHMLDIHSSYTNYVKCAMYVSCNCTGCTT